MDGSSPSTGAIPIVASSATPTRKARASSSWRPAAVGHRAGQPGPDLATVRFRARCVRVARDEGIAAALSLGVSRASLHRWRVRVRRRRPRGPRRPAAGPVARAPAGLGRAGRDRRPAAHVLEQQAPGGRVHAAGDLPARPPRRRPAPGRSRHGPPVGPPRARSGLRAGPAQRAVAHRHQGPVLPAPLGARVREGLDRRPRRRPLPLPHRPARPAASAGRGRSSPGSTTASSCAGRRSS